MSHLVKLHEKRIQIRLGNIIFALICEAILIGKNDGKYTIKYSILFIRFNGKLDCHQILSDKPVCDIMGVKQTEMRFKRTISTNNNSFGIDYT